MELPIGFVYAACTVLVLVVVGLIYLAVAARPQKAPTVPTSPLADLPGQDVVIRVLSERISALEGRLPQLVVAIESASALAARLGQLEASMPSLLDAYERYGDQVARADKRDTERHRKNESDAVRKKSALDTAMDMGIPVTVPPPPNGATQPSSRVPGILGSGSRGRA